MNGTEHFTRTIAEYLNQRAVTDTLFSLNLAKPHKNIEDCITYILNQVQSSGCNGFEDDEIYSMAVHYYDEDDIDVGKKTSCNVVVNHTIVLTEEEKAEARRCAIQQFQNDEYRKLSERKNKAKSSVPTDNENIQQSLFDF
jgi:hypothetical protein